MNVSKNQKNVNLKKKNNKEDRVRGAAGIIIIILFSVVAVAAAWKMLSGFNVAEDLPDWITTAALTDHGAAPVTNPPGAETTPLPQTIKRREGVYNFLVLGRDRVASLTDVFMLISFDTVNNSVNIVQVPRDTYIDNGRGDYYKINGLYSYYRGVARNNNSKDIAGDALKLTADYLEGVLCVKIDYQLLLSLDSLIKIVDIIGGVPVTIAEPMKYDDPAQNLHIDLPAGDIVLTGEQSEQFVRFRDGYLLADVGRMDAQKMFMSSFIQQLKQKISITNVAPIVSQLIGGITTNLSAGEFVSCVTEALSIDITKMTMLTLPGIDVLEYVNETTGRQWYYVLNRASTLNIVNKYLNVYNVDVGSDVFDKNNMLTAENIDTIHSIYTAEEKSIHEYTGDGVLEEGIYIPTKN